MPLCSIEEAIADIRQGKMIILVDDEGRENEGDLTMYGLWPKGRRPVEKNMYLPARFNTRGTV
jgi:3,4-dihydroxy-2-butanone 4-phosphate synthase